MFVNNILRVRVGGSRMGKRSGEYLTSGCIAIKKNQKTETRKTISGSTKKRATTTERRLYVFRRKIKKIKKNVDEYRETGPCSTQRPLRVYIIGAPATARKRDEYSFSENKKNVKLLVVRIKFRKKF